MKGRPARRRGGARRDVKVRFHGVRGSIATPGPSTVRYGGNTVCVEVRLSDGTLLVFDGGTGIRELGKELMREGFDGPVHLLLTHLHWDHIMGIPFFAPIYSPGRRILVHPLFTETQRGVLRNRTLFDGIHFPVREADIPAHMEFLGDVDEAWRVGSATLRRIELNHPGGAQGFRIDDDGGTSLAYLTDNELSPPGKVDTSAEQLARFARGVDLMVHDAQYLAADMPAKKGWGHSTADEALRLAVEAEARELILFHHDPERDDAALDALGVEAAAWMKEHAPATKVEVAREGWGVDVGPGGGG
jgi:phosphoribosyl 1,2-cyclic phosphodiesterase